ncbi:AT DNA binding protein [Thermoascus aurantiacus ATCC 26904]
MSTRSASSSPDVLGPPADIDYLISPAPVKPVPGLRSWYTPSRSKFQTPRKRPRPSTSPTKTTHSFRLDDLMKSTPSKNARGGQGSSLSPSKLQSESNLSPWRIRVTVEAEHEDEMDSNGSAARKRFKTATTTTKVPLKDTEEVSQLSAKKRRGRPRKSDIQEQSATPRRGSPGHTPGRTPGPITTSAVKRKRGRPRKSLPEPEVVESVERAHLPPAETAPREASPLNLAAEGDAADLSSDDGISSPAPFAYDPGPSRLNVTSPNRSSPIQSQTGPSRRPEPPPPKRARILEGDTELSPARDLSPDRVLRDVSPENTLHAGHTPRPRRIYPTPTSSSLIEGENPGEDPTRVAHRDEREGTVSGAISDPTDEHREFDTIMESEGFSMVSLDTLPSVKSLASAKSLSSTKQQALDSTSSNLNLSKGVLKPFFERQTPGSSDRTKQRASGSKAAEVPAAISSPRVQSGVDQRPTASSSQLPVSDSSKENDTSRPKATPAENIVSPKLPAAPAQGAQSAATTKKRSFPSLARVVRAGIALQGILRRQRRGSTLQSPFSSPTRSGTREQSDDSDGPRRRLEHLFSGFGLATQRELRAGLRFGEELARRQREAERRRREEQDRASSSRDITAAETRGVSPEAATQDQTHEDEPETGRLNSEIARRQAEWQCEREAVSREIEMADSNNVIVIDSDKEMSDRPEGEEDDYEAEERVPDDDDDDDYYDIWQQEAHASRLNESSISHRQERKAQEPGRGPNSSPWKSGQSVTSDNGENLPRILWGSPAKQGEFPSLGKSRLRRLREEEVDLSALLRRQDTPNTRKYYGNSSPHSRSSQQLQPSDSHNPSSPARLPTSSPQRDEQTSPHRQSSPRRSPSRSSDEASSRWEESPGPEDSVSQQSDDEHSDNELHENDDREPSHAAMSDKPSMHETQTSQPARQTTSGARASSWFRRLSNFAPAFWRRENTEPDEEPPEEPYEEPGDDAEDLPAASPTLSPNRSPVAETPLPEYELPDQSPSPDQSPIAETPLPEQISASPTLKIQPERQNVVEPRGKPPLAVSGYFTDDHYYALRRLYRLAKRSPELFPYYPTPGREDIIGDWLWTSDGAYGIPVTELQFAIIDRFVRDLAEADIRNGGTGEIGWSEEELYKRLFCIIIGEQIRAQRKAQALEEEEREREGEGADK